MNYFNPSNNRSMSSGELAQLYGTTFSEEALNANGYFEVLDLVEGDETLRGLLKKTQGFSSYGNKFIQNYTLNDTLAALLTRFLSGTLNPIGQVTFFAGSAAPSGFLVCDGSVYQVEDYPGLAATLTDTYGGDGVTTFAVPDLRGQFLRGWDEAGGTPAGVDPSRVFGSTQADELAAHDHYIPTNDASAAGSFTVADLANQTLDYTNLSATSSTGGTETRPTNVALLPCIYSGVFA